MSKADEIKKLKELLDDGILTEEEFNKEKNKLLNKEKTERINNYMQEMDNKYSSTPSSQSVQNVYTGEAGCPRCGSTRLQNTRSRTSKLIGKFTLGFSNLIYPKTAVRCLACNKYFLRYQIRKY